MFCRTVACHRQTASENLLLRGHIRFFIGKNAFFLHNLKGTCFRNILRLQRIRNSNYWQSYGRLNETSRAGPISDLQRASCTTARLPLN